jgi:hypothetical protein
MHVAKKRLNYVNTRFSDRELALIVEACRCCGLTRSQLVRRAVGRYSSQLRRLGKQPSMPVRSDRC